MLRRCGMCWRSAVKQTALLPVICFIDRRTKALRRTTTCRAFHIQLCHAPAGAAGESREFAERGHAAVIMPGPCGHHPHDRTVPRTPNQRRVDGGLEGNFLKTKRCVIRHFRVSNWPLSVASQSAGGS